MTKPFYQDDKVHESEEKLRRAEETARQQELSVRVAEEKLKRVRQDISNIDGEIARQKILRDDALLREKTALRKAMMWRFGPIFIASLFLLLLLLK